MDHILTTTSATVIRSCQLLDQVADNRCRLYQLLATCFYPPSTSLFLKLENGQLEREFSECTTWLGVDQAKFSANLDQLSKLTYRKFEQIEDQYDSLFGKSISRVSAHESSYRWRDVSAMGASSQRFISLLNQEYLRFGVHSEKGMEDHVAVELEFMAFLCEQEAGYWQQRLFVTARELRRQERVFLEDHLGRWFPELCWQIAQRQKDTLYGCVARLCETWLSIDFGAGYLPVKL